MRLPEFYNDWINKQLDGFVMDIVYDCPFLPNTSMDTDCVSCKVGRYFARCSHKFIPLVKYEGLEDA